MNETDQLKPMTIKSIATRVADEITHAARTSVPKVTVGQLVEKVWEHWKDAGRTPERGQPTALAMPTVDEVWMALDAAAKVPQLRDEGVQLGVRTEANRVVKVMLLDLKVRMKAAYGLPGGQKPQALEHAVDQAIERVAVAA